MKDAKTGLYYYGYDESREMYWANEFRLQRQLAAAAGWFLVAMVNVGADGQPALLQYRAIALNAEGHAPRWTR